MREALMSIKASFSNVVNVLLDWDYAQNEDFCSWSGVSCGNFSSYVVALGPPAPVTCLLRIFISLAENFRALCTGV
ncbi:LRR receptor-like serine/threonine-protein kinase ERL2 isoform X2 [Henckelia pumila]|uniref:LRR receptor-like serine/threonine-protein kinase ERL2 isoform X2 n=1 Tax=Henckelia pumila TaxID=405737 RepID=UPI003C6E4180